MPTLHYPNTSDLQPTTVPLRERGFTAPRVAKKKALAPIKKEVIRRDSRSRFESRNAKLINFERYNLAKHSILPAKPSMDYQRELQKRPNAPYLLGFELEIENAGYGDADLKELAAILQKYLPKEHFVCTDGSLQSGVEIVTAPRSPTEIKDSFHEYFMLARDLQSAGWRSHDSGRCGLHFHISKNAMSNDKWEALQRLLKKYSMFFKAVSRREEFRYCEFSGSSDSRRYQALNFQPEYTREFRFFRGTVNANSFLGSTDMIMCLVNYWRSANKGTIRGFIKYMQKHHKYAYKMSEPHLNHLPNIEITRRRYTPEERAALKEARIQRALDLYNNTMAEITAAIESAQACWSPPKRVMPGDTIVELRLPIELQGRWSKLAYKIACENYLTVVLPIQSTERAKYIQAGRVLILTKMRGYGRTRTISGLSWQATGIDNERRSSYYGTATITTNS